MLTGLYGKHWYLFVSRCLANSTNRACHMALRQLLPHDEVNIGEGRRASTYKTAPGFDPVYFAFSLFSLLYSL